MLSLPPSVLRAHNSEDSGIFLPFLFRQRRLLYRLSKTTERCFLLYLSSVYRRFRLRLFSRTWCAPLRSQLLAHYIICLHGIWTRFWSTCQALLRALGISFLLDSVQEGTVPPSYGYRQTYGGTPGSLILSVV